MPAWRVVVLATKKYLLGAMVRRLMIFELANPSHLLRQLFGRSGLARTDRLRLRLTRCGNLMPTEIWPLREFNPGWQSSRSATTSGSPSAHPLHHVDARLTGPPGERRQRSDAGQIPPDRLRNCI